MPIAIWVDVLPKDRTNQVGLWGADGLPELRGKGPSIRQRLFPLFNLFHMRTPDSDRADTASKGKHAEENNYRGH